MHGLPQSLGRSWPRGPSCKPIAFFLRRGLYLAAAEGECQQDGRRRSQFIGSVMPKALRVHPQS